MNRSLLLYLLFLLLSFSFTSKANIKLPDIFADGMVLQRNVSNKIWGWAEANEQVILKFAGKRYITKTGSDLKWSFETEEMAAGGPYQILIEGKNLIQLVDVLIGDVWICSGQSNMEFPLLRAKERYKDEIANASNPNIRQIALDHTYKFFRADELTSKDGWLKSDPKNVLKFTAVGYFFAKQLYKKYKVPIGLIHTSWGGTPAQSWTSTEGLKSFPNYYSKALMLTEPAQIAAINSKDSSSISANSNAKPTNFSIWPATLFNGMIAPLLATKIKGVIWYQGEANTHKAKEYYTLFPNMINDWRSNFAQGDFPFLFVQLANYLAVKQEPAESDWAELRAAQKEALKLPNTAMAVTYDLGEAKDIHPHNKLDVGLRLAALADKIAYGNKNLVASGPEFKEMTIIKNTAFITFNNIAGGLITNDGKVPRHFAIAGRDNKFVWATAKIENNKIVVFSDLVSEPVSVRYAWADNPEGANLMNKNGFLAAPFRTDN